MKYGMLFILAFLSFSSLANESIADRVCNAYSNKQDKDKCFNELRNSEPEEKKITKLPAADAQNNKKKSGAELENVFDVIQKSFVDTNSKSLIKYRLDKAMTLYKTPLTIDNYHKCASSLVAMRKHSGHSEMDILQFMIRMHSSESDFNFPTGAAFAATLMGE